MIKDRYGLAQMLLFTVSILVMLASFYLQYVKGLQPCPLCVMQRLCVMLVLLVSLMGMLIKLVQVRHILIVLQIIIAVAGLYFSCRQLWLQSLPADQLPACLPGLDVLLRHFPWRDVVQAMIWGAADCGEITWQWLGLTMPGWSLLYFAGILSGSFFCSYLLHRSQDKSTTQSVNASR